MYNVICPKLVFFLSGRAVSAPDFGSRGRAFETRWRRDSSRTLKALHCTEPLCSPSHRLEMTEILLKGRKTLTHPSIYLFF